MAEFDRVVRPKEASRLLGVARQTLYEWVKEGRLPPPRKLGRRAVGWPLSELSAFIAESSRGPADAATEPHLAAAGA